MTIKTLLAALLLGGKQRLWPQTPTANSASMNCSPVTLLTKKAGKSW
jgi:hypothetical protein